MKTHSSIDRICLYLLILVLLVDAGCIAWSLWDKYPWHDEITTSFDIENSYSTLAFNYYTHKGHLLLAKTCSLLFGESFLSIRLPAALFGLAGLIGVYLLGRRFYGPVLGLFCAIYFALHPSHLFHSSDARGYMGATVLSVFGVWALWNAVQDGKVTTLFVSILLFFAAYQMHPTGALLFPGVLVGTAWIAFSRLKKLTVEKRRDAIRRATVGAGVVVAIGLLLFGPRISRYLQAGSLMIPRRFWETGGSMDHQNPLLSAEGFSYYASALVSAQLHFGPILWFGMLLFLCGLFPRNRADFDRVAFLACPFLSPFAFFLIYNPVGLPQRYLFVTLPFFILLVAGGIQNLANACGSFSPHRWRSCASGGLGGLLACILALFCYGPFRAELAFGDYGSTWMIPLAKLAHQPFMRPVHFYFIDNLPLWRDQMVKLGMEKESVSLIDPESVEENLAGKGNSRPASFVFKVYSDFTDQQSKLREQGHLELQIEQGIFFFHPGFLQERDADGKARWEEIIGFLSDLNRLDYRFLYSASQWARHFGQEEKADVLQEKAVAQMERSVVWDYPRTYGRLTAPIARFYLQKENHEAAARWYAHCFGRHYSRHHDYIGFIDKLPQETVKAAFNSSMFLPQKFSDGFVHAFEQAPTLERDYKAYWSFRGAQALDWSGFKEEAVRLYRYSVRHGDSLGRSTEILFNYYLERKNHRGAAAAVLLGLQEGVSDVGLVLEVFEKIPEPKWSIVRGLPGFDETKFAQDFVEALNEENEVSEPVRVETTERMMRILNQMGCSEGEAILRESLSSHGELGNGS